MEQPKENADSTDTPVKDTSMINVVWFKRDLRLEDHAPLKAAIEVGLPVLLVYVFEPSLQQSPDWNIRHWQFVYQSIEDLNFELEDYQVKLHCFHAEVPDVFEYILKTHQIDKVFSHQETGIRLTYDRDRQMQQFFEQKDIEWQEFEQNGIQRGRKNRRGWAQDWQIFMKEPLATPNLAQLKAMPYEVTDFAFLFDYVTGQKIHLYSKNYQPVGMRSAQKYLKAFGKKCIVQYTTQHKQPALSNQSNSHLSPYLAWGNLSVRQVYQHCQQLMIDSPHRANFETYLHHLRMHCQCIQKFEMEDYLEFEAGNEAYLQLEQNHKNDLLEAWKNGQTGFPLVDASMRCIRQTGYLNFQMRSLIVSFLTHHLWQSWHTGVHYLGQQFLDYEPGVHFVRFQAQAGAVDTHKVKILNPIKVSKKCDPKAQFIKKWVPELKNIPAGLIHDLSKMTTIEQIFYKCTIGQDYPAPIININATHPHAKAALEALKKNEEKMIHSIELVKEQPSVDYSPLKDSTNKAVIFSDKHQRLTIHN
ncbi:FAD-binding domain-containing protein [Microscilla marina]|nr:FAD-binding domain-containing protein [Microscilla marina]